MKIFSAILLLALVSCDEPSATSEGDATYFPLQNGIYHEYHVERTTYAIGEMPQVTDATIRRSVDSAFRIDSENVFLVKYATLLAENVWRDDSSHAVWKTGGQILEQENGQSVVKIQEPVNEGLKWNVNAYNATPPLICEMKQVNMPLTIGAHFYPKTVSIVRQNDSTLLSKKKYMEIYAENVGLVEREIVNVKYCQSGNCIGKGIAESGWKELITLTKSGIR